MRRDLLHWDQARTLARRYGFIFSRTNIYSPPRLPASGGPAYAQRSAPVGPGTHARQQVWHHIPQDQYLQSSSQPVEALHMRRDLLQWDRTLSRSLTGMVLNTPGPLSAVLPASGGPAHTQRSSPVGPATHAPQQIGYRLRHCGGSIH
jgi:hypothetical protein